MNHPYNAIPTEVFHYTKRATALEKILFEKKIMLGQLQFTNDPRENKEERSFRFIYPKAGKERHKDTEAWVRKETNRIIQQEWKMLSVSRHHPQLKPQSVSILDKHEILNPNDSSSLYSNPFMSGSYRPRMWAQYAENHQGVCLKFDGIKLHNRIQKDLGEKCQIRWGEIDYNDYSLLDGLRINLSDFLSSGNRTEVLRDYILKNYEKVFFRKAEDWETEYEFRWLIHSKKLSAEFVSIEGAIDEVLVGVDFPKAYEPSLIKLCHELNIPAGRIIWVNGIPYLEPEIIYQP